MEDCRGAVGFVQVGRGPCGMHRRWLHIRHCIVPWEKPTMVVVVVQGAQELFFEIAMLSTLEGTVRVQL